MKEVLEARLRVRARSLRAALGAIVGAGADHGLVQPESTSLSLDSNAHTEPVRVALGAAELILTPVAAEIVEASLFWSGPDERAAARATAATVDVLRKLAEQRALLMANGDRLGAAFVCMPRVPLADRGCTICFCGDEDIDDGYAERDAFAGEWENLGRYYGTNLLARGVHCQSDREFLGECLHSQWALARAARPRLARHDGELPPPLLQDVYRAGPPRLGLVGYIAPIRTIEYTCVLEPDEHVQGWEIDEIRWTLQAGKVVDGRPVSAIRVVFPIHESAMRERRPLLDVGATVVYLEGGRDVPLTK